MFLYKGHSGLATIYISWMVAETKSSCKICNVRKDSAVSYLRLRIQISEITNFLGTISYPELRYFMCQAGNPPSSGDSPQRKSRSYKGEVVRLLSYNCTTIGCIVVRLKGL